MFTYKAYDVWYPKAEEYGNGIKVKDVFFRHFKKYTLEIDEGTKLQMGECIVAWVGTEAIVFDFWSEEEEFKQKFGVSMNRIEELIEKFSE